MREPVKILGAGELDRPLTVKAHKFSASAREKILAAGGTVEELRLGMARRRRGALSRASQARSRKERAMIEAVRNAFRLPDLRRKLLITLGILVIYRLASHIPVPGVDRAALAQHLRSRISCSVC